MSVSKPEPLAGGIAEAAQIALVALQEGRREEAVLTLYRHAYAFILTRLMEGVPRQNAPGLSYEDAEDEIYPLLDRFSKTKPSGKSSGIGWLRIVIDSHLLDTQRRRTAAKRGGGLKFTSTHDEEGNITPEAEGGGALWDRSNEAVNMGLDDCMERATAEFEQDRPTYGRLLRLLRQGLEGDDLVIHYAENPAQITDQDRRNFKSRKSTALKHAREYFEPCKEMSDE